jgi:hypothetical protein
MLKITTMKGTKLTHKAGTLEEINENGFLINADEGNEYITLDLIKEHFLGKEVRITIEEISKEVLEV